MYKQRLKIKNLILDLKNQCFQQKQYFGKEKGSKTI